MKVTRAFFTQAFFVSLSVLFNFLVAHADPQCVFLLGDHQDWNNAFKGYGARFEASRTEKGSKIGQFNCKGFDSWADADAYLKSSNLQKGEQVLFVQYAHGSPGGDSALNAGNISGASIKGYLERYSKDYRVGALLVTCYSGDILKSMVIDQYRNSSANENLCLLPASPLGEVGLSFDPLDNRGASLTETFLNNNFQFLTSAIPFSELGLDQLWNDRISAEEALKMFVNKVVQFKHLTPTQKKLLELSLDKRFSSSLRLSSSSQHRTDYARVLLKHVLEEQTLALQTPADINECRQLAVAEIQAESQLSDQELFESMASGALIKKLSDVNRLPICQKILQRRQSYPVPDTSSVFNIDFMKLLGDFPYITDRYSTTVLNNAENEHFLFKYAALTHAKDPGFVIPKNFESYSLLENTSDFKMAKLRSDGEARYLLYSFLGDWNTPISLKKLFATPESLKSSYRFDQIRKQACDQFLY